MDDHFSPPLSAPGVAIARLAVLGALLLPFVASPASGASWEAVGPQGGPVTAIAARATFAMAATPGGLVVSRDGARSWQLLQAAPARPYTLAIAPGDARHLWIATLDPARTDYSAGGIFESRDQGATWIDRSAGLALPSGYVRFTYQFAFPYGDDAPVIATDHGVLALADTWQPLSLPDSFVWSIAGTPGADGALLAGVYLPPFPAPGPDSPRGILRSEDGGRSWTSAAPNAVPSRFVLDPSRPGRVLALDASPVPGRILRSDDAGAHWTRLAGPGDLRDLAALADGTLLAASGHGVLRSRDAGVTWRSTALAGEELASVAATGATRALAAGSRGVWRSEDGAATFRPASSGWSAQAITSLTIDPAGTALVATTGVLRSTNGGGHWTQSIPSQPFFAPVVAAAPSAAGRFYVVALPDGRIGRSSDGGRTWIPGAFVGTLLNGLTVDPNDADTVYVAESEQNGRDLFSCTLKSSDGGEHFVCLTAPWADDYGHRLFTDEIAVRPGDASFLLARVYALLARSRDGGATWQSFAAPGSRTATPTALAFDPAAPARVLVATNEAVWLSRDDATTFTRSNAGLPERAAITGLLADPLHPGVFYAGVRRLSAAGVPVAGEVYRSIDGGASWRRLGDRLPREFTGRIAYDAARGSLLAATAGRGVYRLSLAEN